MGRDGRCGGVGFLDRAIAGEAGDAANLVGVNRPRRREGCRLARVDRHTKAHGRQVRQACLVHEGQDIFLFPVVSLEQVVCGQKPEVLDRVVIQLDDEYAFRVRIGRLRRGSASDAAGHSQRQGQAQQDQYEDQGRSTTLHDANLFWRTRSGRNKPTPPSVCRPQSKQAPPLSESPFSCPAPGCTRTCQHGPARDGRRRRDC